VSVVVVDTAVASFIFAGRPEFALYEGDMVGHTTALAFQTVAEMRLGAELKGWGKKKRAALESFLESHLTIFAEDETIEAWVVAMSVSEKAGRALGDDGAWIAACAMVNGARLLTHDGDFRGLVIPGLDVVCHAP
jgi:predicted nucleic acid-binding protein